jgi:prevent-host-death family protein
MQTFIQNRVPVEVKMVVHTLPSRDFARDVSNAKRLASDGPVFITDRGKPAFALLKIEDYSRLSKAKPKSLLEVMDAIAGGHFDFEPPRMDGEFKPVSFD